MKKIFLFCLVLVGVLSFSQSWEGGGDQKLQFGLDSHLKASGVMFSYDYGIASMVSLGAETNLFVTGDGSGGTKNHFSAYGRLSFHLNKTLDLPSSLDIYPGVALGIWHGLDFRGYIGLRFFITEKLGVFGEFGNKASLGLSVNI